jgi:hypothetical protein
VEELKQSAFELELVEVVGIVVERCQKASLNSKFLVGRIHREWLLVGEMPGG